MNEFKYIAVLLSFMITQIYGSNEWCTDSTTNADAPLTPELDDGSNAEEEFRVDEAIHLYCCFVSQKTVNVVWFKNNESIVAGPRYQLSENNQVLTIPKSSKSDDGKYRCEGSNKHGKQSWDIEVNIHATVCNQTPEIRSKKPVVTVKRGGKITLICIVTSKTPCESPFPTYFWRNKRGKLEPRDRRSKMRAKYLHKNNSIRMKLRIKNVNKRHAGNHTCIVKDLNGESSSNVLLVVL